MWRVNQQEEDNLWDICSFGGNSNVLKGKKYWGYQNTYEEWGWC